MIRPFGSRRRHAAAAAFAAALTAACVWAFAAGAAFGDPSDASSTERLVQCFADPGNPAQQAAARSTIASLRESGWNEDDIRIALALANLGTIPVANVVAMKRTADFQAGPGGRAPWDQIVADLGLTQALMQNGSRRGSGGFVASAAPRVIQTLNARACWRSP